MGRGPPASANIRTTFVRKRGSMPIYQARLRKHEEIAERTMAFHFEKPPGLEFRAGQFIDLTLLHPEEMDSQGATRTFTIASAPYEDELLLATRMRNTAFKRVLGALPAGAGVKLEGPMGSFTLHRNPAKAAVFLAGGIGITPFRSILRQAAVEKLSHQIYLFYSNRRPEDAAFLKELENLADSSLHFIFVPTMTEMGNSSIPWQGARSFIDRDMLVEHFCELRGPIYYAAGPPAMVAAMRQMLLRLGVDDDDIRTEEFGGY